MFDCLVYDLAESFLIYTLLTGLSELRLSMYRIDVGFAASDHTDEGRNSHLNTSVKAQWQMWQGGGTDLLEFQGQQG